MSTTNNPGCLGWLVALFEGRISQGSKPVQGGGPLPYRVRDDFLSPAERSFYGVLSQVAGTRAIICPKVRLADLFFVARPNQNRTYQSRIAQKHVDFVLCEPGTLRPLAGVELDDASHARPDRRARDEFVNQVFAAAGLALVHVPVQARGYTPSELETLVGACLSGGAVAPLSVVTPPNPPVPYDFDVFVGGTLSVSSAPTCPKCSVPMVLRIAARGERQGKPFFGCRNYPRCRQTAPVPDSQQQGTPNA